jgi:two-component system response regulator RegX3
MAAPRKILICEDEDAIREFEVINLQRSGYEVVDVSCGEDAIRVFDEQGDSFSVAILDIMMPGIDGFAVCKHIREKNNTLGIIMLSAKSQEMDKVNGLMLGADDYITKPFSPSELVADLVVMHRGMLFEWRIDEQSFDPVTRGCRMAQALLDGWKQPE